MSDQDRSVEGTKQGRARDGRTVLLTLAAVLLIWFVVANTKKVQVHFWVFTATTSLIAVILVSAALGAVLALLLGKKKHHKN